ncbi:MAG TPA: alpha/beta fold hydrolase, partial [Pseudomonadales bacterium]
MMQKIDTSFPVHGTAVRGFFHLPAAAGDGRKLPLIVMFNGYATEWQFGTAAFIERFTALGFATLNFDYRSFGGSDGEPRQLLDIPAQLQDCAAAIAHGLVQDWVDETRVLVWGSSLGGGHALTMASEFDQLAGMLAQVPHCSSRAAFKTVTLKAVFKGMSAAIADAIGSRFGAAPRYIPVLPPAAGEYGVLAHPGWAEHYLALAEGSPTWRNAIVARSLLRGSDYEPQKTAG